MLQKIFIVEFSAVSQPSAWATKFFVILTSPVPSVYHLYIFVLGFLNYSQFSPPILVTAFRSCPNFRVNLSIFCRPWWSYLESNSTVAYPSVYIRLRSVRQFCTVRCSCHRRIMEWNVRSFFFICPRPAQCRTNRGGGGDVIHFAAAGPTLRRRRMTLAPLQPWPKFALASFVVKYLCTLHFSCLSILLRSLVVGFSILVMYSRYFCRLFAFSLNEKMTHQRLIIAALLPPTENLHQLS